MFRLRLNAKHCISCGLCMDVCRPEAIRMQISGSAPVEGGVLSYMHLHPKMDDERLPEVTMTFPYLAQPHLCDGCMLCVRECPTTALELYRSGQTPETLFHQDSPHVSNH